MMAKAAGIIALILGIISITPLLLFIPVVWWIIPLLAFILGIVGAATAKGKYKKGPSIAGIVLGVIGFGMYFFWAFLFVLFALGSVLGASL
jgi:hypothetical protein